ncbi:MAG: hypothetical protein V1862_02505 [Methanobacteriota archaeon]
MSHDKKKKSKNSIEAARVPVEAVVAPAKGSSTSAGGKAQKGSDDAKISVKGAVPDLKDASNKASKSKKR